MDSASQVFKYSLVFLVAMNVNLVPANNTDGTCQPGLDCIHGYCPAGTVNCVCEEGWAGFRCEQPCPKDCVMNGACHTSPEGIPYCSCHVGYTLVNGIGCVRENTTVTPPKAEGDLSLRPLAQRTCVPGFVCVHGYCAQGSLSVIKCICDGLWKGQLCQTLCNKNCSQFGRCNTYGNGTAYCQCDRDHTGEFCDVALQANRTVPQASNLSKSPLSASPAEAASRECVPGFVCVHGLCKSGDISCLCDKGYTGLFCDQPCPLECGNGECMIHSTNKTAFCSCPVRYTGANCTEIRVFPDDDEIQIWQWYVVGACGGLLLLLLLILGVLPYVLWKRGHIFFLKIVYHFQSYEDDDNKLYDAFVSYKSSDMDEHFVVSELFPKLEQEMNFRLCLHFRDFVPGETIANNIIKAMENSRRTILVVTPNFIESEFCRFEYQRAQVEMLKRKQRIIPVILRDITREKEQMDETLRTILETITYLNWPEDNDPKKIEKFWKRLELSMPKKKTSNKEPSTPQNVVRRASDSSSSSTSRRENVYRPFHLQSLEKRPSQEALKCKQQEHFDTFKVDILPRIKRKQLSTGNSNHAFDITDL